MLPELENIVTKQSETGALSVKSRELLLKKAEQLGEDPLDFELELEQIIAEA